MKVLTDEGLQIYYEESKNYIDESINSVPIEEMSDTEPTSQKNGDIWLKKID